MKFVANSSPVPVDVFLPFNPRVFVDANSNAALRVVNAHNSAEPEADADQVDISRTVLVHRTHVNRSV